MEAACNEPLMVTVQCLAYNQEAFIRQCLDGFVMQRTNFRFEAVVHDDASTDGTPAIIREYAAKYPDIIKPILETENQYSKHDGSLKRAIYAHTHGKYVALCEGDDYWTDPLKLQKQVDLMEAHPDCMLTYHACKNVFEGEGLTGAPYGEDVKESYTAAELLDYPFQTATVMFRREVTAGNALYDRATAVGCSSGDEILYLTAGCLGTVCGINERMSVYRRHASGVSQQMHGKDRMWKNFNDWLQLADVFGGEVGRRIRHDRLGELLYYSLRWGRFGMFWKMLRTCVRRSPSTIVGAATFRFRCMFR